MAPVRRARESRQATRPPTARPAQQKKKKQQQQQLNSARRRRQSRYEFAARDILAEEPTRYLIDWEGYDPDTGRPYEPTWEPKGYANPALRKDWEKRKRQSAAGTIDLPAASTPEPATRTRAREVPLHEASEAETASSVAPQHTPVREDQGDTFTHLRPIDTTEAAQSTQLEARDVARQEGSDSENTCSSAPQQAPAEERRQTTFTHSQPTPTHTPEFETGPASVEPPRAEEPSPASWRESPSPVSVVDNIRVVPSPRALASSQYEVFNSQRSESQDNSPRWTQGSTRTASSIARLLNPIVPDSQSWSASASYQPSTQNGANTQETTSDSQDPSPIEEITQFHVQRRQQQTQQSDPIVDSQSPPRVRTPVRIVLPRSVKRARPSSNDSTPSPSQSSPRGERNQTRSFIPSSGSRSRRTPPSFTHQTGVATDSASGTAEVFPSIEQSVTAAHSSLQTSPSRSRNSRADKAKAATENLRHSVWTASPTDLSLVRRRLPQERPALVWGGVEGLIPHFQSTAQRELLGRSTATNDTATHSARSTRFESRVQRTPRRTMEAASEDSSAPSGSQLNAQALQEKFAEIDNPRPTRGRSFRAVLDPPSADQTRSPSAIPDRIPAPSQPGAGTMSRMQIADFGPELQPPSMQSIEINVEPPPAGESPAGDRSSPLSEAPDEVSEPSPPPEPFPNLGVAEFVIVLPSPASSTDAYRKHITAHADLIETFCSPRWQGDAETAEKAAALVQQLKNYVTHSDLENEDVMTQQTGSDVPLPLVADWDMNVSSKFNFFGHLLEAVRNIDMHIVVTAGSKSLLDILENFLRGKDIKLFRPHFNAAKPASGTSSVTVSLLDTSGEGAELLPRAADIVLSFDNTLDTSNARMRAMRVHLGSPGQTAPIVHLFVNYAIEHIERCVPNEASGSDRLRQLLTTAAMYRKQAGRLHDGYPRPKEAAYSLANYYLLSRDPSSPPPEWPVPDAEIIHTELSSAESSSGPEVDGASFDPAVGQKRPMIDELSGDLKKRARVDEPTTDSTSGGGTLSAVTDSQADSSKEHNPADPPVSSVVAEPTEHQHESGNTAPAADGETLARILDLTNRVVALNEALEGLQFRFEEQSKGLSSTRKEREAAKTQAAIYQKQVETRDASITTLKDERAELRKQLQAANEALKASEVPEVAELAGVRAELANAVREREKAEARYKSQETTMDYTRMQYQQASGRAMELTGEVAEARSRVAELEKLASGEAARLKGLVVADRERAWREENERLRGTAQSLEVLVQRVQEENRNLKNQGRVQTRQGSMPPAAAAAAAAARSPRLAPLSRTGSPAPLGLGVGVGRLREGPRA